MPVRAPGVRGKVVTVRHNDEQAQRFFTDGVHATGATTVMRGPDDLYAAWRNLPDLPRFITNLKRVEVVTPLRSRWTVEGPGGLEHSWNAELIADEPGRLLAWKSLGETTVPNAGSVRFSERSHGRGTIIRVSLEYVPPAGSVGDAVARALGDDPQTVIHEALHRFRQIMEAGEVATSTGQPAGSSSTRKDRVADVEKRSADADVRDIAATTGGGL